MKYLLALLQVSLLFWLFGCDSTYPLENGQLADSLAVGEWENLGYPGADIRQIEVDSFEVYVAGGHDGLFRVDLAEPNRAWTYLGFSDTSSLARDGVSDIEARDGDLLLSRVSEQKYRPDPVWRSLDRGITWSRASAGIGADRCPRAVILSARRSPHEPARAIAMQGPWYSSDDGGSTWIIGEERTECAYTGSSGVRWNPGVPGEVWLSQNGFLGTVLLISRDYGQTWSASYYTQDYGHTDDLAFDAQNPQVVYASADGNLLKSTNGGVTGQWQVMCQSCTEAIATDPSRGGVLYRTYRNEVFVSEDGGQTWHELAIRLDGAGVTMVYSEMLESLMIATRTTLYRYKVRLKNLE